VSSRGVDEAYYHEIGTRPIQSGSFYLHPHWRWEYVAETRALVDTEPDAAPR
jgi:hypothetical protein